jgi:DNA-binding phage protein
MAYHLWYVTAVSERTFCGTLPTGGDQMAETPLLDTSRHRRLLDEQLHDPIFQAGYERALAEIAQVDAVINALDQLRVQHQISKGELARQVGKNPANIRRLFTAEANPELRTVAALATALGAEIRIVSKRRRAGGRHDKLTAAAG